MKEAIVNILIGAVFACIPLWYGIKKKQIPDAICGFAAALAVSFFSTYLISAVAAGVFSIMIFFRDKKRKEQIEKRRLEKEKQEEDEKTQTRKNAEKAWNMELINTLNNKEEDGDEYMENDED